MAIEKLNFTFKHLELEDIDSRKVVEAYNDKINEIVDFCNEMEMLKNYWIETGVLPKPDKLPYKN